MILNLNACDNGAESLTKLNDLIDEHNNEKANLDSPIFINGIQVSTGDLSVGNLSPIARANFFGGSAAKALLYFEPQASYSGPVNSGLVWNDNVKKSLIEQQLIGDKVLIGFLSGATGNSNTVTNTTAVTLITNNGYTFVIPANSLTVGKRIRIHFRGRYGTAGTPNLTFNFQIGGTIVKTTGARAMGNSASNRGFRGYVDLRVDSIGATGSINTSIQTLISDNTQFVDGSSTPNLTNALIDTTIINTLQMSVRWGTANPNNTILFEDITYECLN